MQNKATKNNTLLLSIMFVFMLFVSNPTFAADSNVDTALFTPAPNDFSLAILSQLFGELIDLAGGHAYQYSGNMFLGEIFDPLKDVIQVFNSLCLFVVGILVAMGFIQKITYASQQHKMGEAGNVLLWVRYALGSLYILPLKGYCVLQIVVMWLLINSIGAADSLSKTMLGIQNNAHATTINGNKGNIDAMYSIKMPAPQVAQLVYKTAEGYSCLYGIASQRVADRFALNYDKYKNLSLVSNNSLEGNTLSAYNEKRKQNNIVQNNKNITFANSNVMSLPEGSLGATPSNVLSQSEVSQQMKTNEQDFSKNVLNQEINRQGLIIKAEDAAFKESYKSLTTDLTQSVNSIFGENADKKDAVYETPFYFGLQPDSMGNIKNVRNKTISDVCGYIDFKTSVNSTAAQEIFQKAQKSWDKANASGTINNDVHKIGKDALILGKLEADKKGQSRYSPSLVKAYLVVYNKYRQMIADASKDYVSKINAYVRFVQTKSGRLIDAPLSRPELESKRIQILDEYNNKLFNISRKMELDLQKGIVEYFRSQSNSNLVNHYLNYGIDSLPKIIEEMGGNTQTNFVDARNLANAMAYRDGWVTTGTLFMLLTQSINQAQMIANFSPAMGFILDNNKSKFTDIIGNGEKGVLDPQFGVNAFNDVQAFYGFYQNIAIRSEHPAIIRDLNPPSGTANNMASLALGLDLTSLNSSGRHPLIIMVEAGYSLLNAAEKFLSYTTYWEARRAVAFKQGAKGMGGLANPADPTSSMSAMLTVAMGMLVVMGFMLAFYLPVLPFLIWIGGVLGWLVSAIEAIFICPLWGAMHLSLDGSQLVGKAQAGYSQLMALLFRAPLMVMGFWAGFVVLQVYGIYLNYVFGFSVMLSLGGTFSTEDMTFVSLCTVLCVYGIYALYMQIIITKIMHLPMTIPDNTFKWIGASNSNLSEYGGMAGAELNGRMSTFGQTFANAGMQKQMTNAKMAAQTDINEISALRSDDPKLNTATGSGFDAIFNHGNMAGSNFKTMNNQGDNYNLLGTQPMTPHERENLKTTQDDAYNITQHAGIENNEGQDISKKLALQSYHDDNVDSSNFRNTLKQWSDDGVFSRSKNTKEHYQALKTASNASNAKEANQILNDYVHKSGLDNGVSSQNETRTPSNNPFNLNTFGGNTSGMNTGSINTSGMNTGSINTSGVNTASINTSGVNTVNVNTPNIKTPNIDTASINNGTNVAHSQSVGQNIVSQATKQTEIQSQNVMNSASHAMQQNQNKLDTVQQERKNMMSYDQNRMNDQVNHTNEQIQNNIQLATHENNVKMDNIKADIEKQNPTISNDS